MQRHLQLLTGPLAILDDTVQTSVWGTHQLGVHKLAPPTQFNWDTYLPLRQMF